MKGATGAKPVMHDWLVTGVRYVWRLDDDSFITRPIRYDVFRLLRDRRVQYAYVNVVADTPQCIIGSSSRVVHGLDWVGSGRVGLGRDLSVFAWVGLVPLEQKY